MSIESKTNEVLWVEKYRPQKIDDTILPEKTKTMFKKFVADDSIPNLLLTGGPGVGKTTIAKAMLEEMGCDYKIMNGSLNVNIDSIRYDISTYASSVSLQGGRKYVIFDEADYLNAANVQPALRNFIEEYSSNCGFIFTCNFKHKIIQPLHSRCSVIDFSFDKSELPKLQVQVAKRVFEILEKENVEYTKEAVIEIVKRFTPDNRRILNELQRYANINGKIDVGLFAVVDSAKIQNFVNFMKTGDFKSCRQFIADNPSPDVIFTELYENITDYVDTNSIPNLILILGEYQYRSSHVANPEINLAAMCVEMMKSVKFK